MSFVGHIFSKGGYTSTQERKDGIVRLGEPKNIKELRKAIGLINFFRDLSNSVKPLTQLTGNKEFKWFDEYECQVAWMKIKEDVANADMLYAVCCISISAL